MLNKPPFWVFQYLAAWESHRRGNDLIQCYSVFPFFLKTVSWHFKLLPDSDTLMLTVGVSLKSVNSNVFILNWKASIVTSRPWYLLRVNWGKGEGHNYWEENVWKHSAALRLCVCVCVCVCESVCELPVMPRVADGHSVWLMVLWNMKVLCQ